MFITTQSEPQRHDKIVEVLGANKETKKQQQQQEEVEKRQHSIQRKSSVNRKLSTHSQRVPKENT